MFKLKSALRFSLLLLVTAPALGGCGDRYSTLPVRGVPATEMPQMDQAIASSTPEAARRGLGNHTWFWTRGPGPAQIHYSTADGRDFVWLIGQRQILAGEVTIGGRTVRDPGHRVNAGDTVTVTLPPPEPAEPALSSLGFAFA